MPLEKEEFSVSQLIYNFFHFYSYDFDPESMQIDIPKGGFSYKDEHDTSAFSIIDPFDLHNNPGKHVKTFSDEHMKIKD